MFFPGEGNFGQANFSLPVNTIFFAIPKSCVSQKYLCLQQMNNSFVGNKKCSCIHFVSQKNKNLFENSLKPNLYP